MKTRDKCYSSLRKVVKKVKIGVFTWICLTISLKIQTQSHKKLISIPLNKTIE